MTYGTPELLVVGPAQNLVLGIDRKNDIPATNFDESLQTYSNYTDIVEGYSW